MTYSFHFLILFVLYLCVKMTYSINKTECNILHENNITKCNANYSCTFIGRQPISMEEKHLIIHMHNRMRHQVGAGLFNGLTATAMPEMSWSQSLEDMATKWTNASHISADPCRITIDGTTAGQNHIILENKYLSRGPVVSVQIALNSWFQEIDNISFKRDAVDRYNGNAMRFARNFSQIIWAETKYVGCSRALLNLRKEEVLYVTCYYLPEGNIPGQKIYNVGEVLCDSCPLARSHSGQVHAIWNRLLPNCVLRLMSIILYSVI